MPRGLLLDFIYFFFLNEYFTCICFFKAQSSSNKTFVKLMCFAGSYTSVRQNSGDVFVHCFISTNNKSISDDCILSFALSRVLSKMWWVEAQRPDFGLQLMSTQYFHSVRIQTEILAIGPLDGCFLWCLDVNQKLGLHFNFKHVTHWHCCHGSVYVSSQQQLSKGSCATQELMILSWAASSCGRFLLCFEPFCIDCSTYWMEPLRPSLPGVQCGKWVN